MLYRSDFGTPKDSGYLGHVAPGGWAYPNGASLCTKLSSMIDDVAGLSGHSVGTWLSALTATTKPAADRAVALASDLAHPQRAATRAAVSAGRVNPGRLPLGSECSFRPARRLPSRWA